MIATTIDYQKLQDWRPKRLYCHFRLSVIVAITWQHFIQATIENAGLAVGISTIYSSVTIFGFGGHIAISGCRSML